MQSQTSLLAEFSYNGKSPVRTINKGDGQPWFIVSDVGSVLGYAKPANISRMLDDDERGSHLVRTPSGDQEMTVCNESGLYHLILKSKREEAKNFRRWVTGTVLPALRQHGAYKVQAEQVLALQSESRLQKELIATQRQCLRAERRVQQLLRANLKLSRLGQDPATQPASAPQQLTLMGM